MFRVDILRPKSKFSSFPLFFSCKSVILRRKATLQTLSFRAVSPTASSSPAPSRPGTPISVWEPVKAEDHFRTPFPKSEHEEEIIDHNPLTISIRSRSLPITVPRNLQIRTYYRLLVPSQHTSPISRNQPLGIHSRNS